MAIYKPNFYKQGDKRWRNYKPSPGAYPNSTMRTTACGPTCIANVVSAMPKLGKSNITPLDAAIWAVSRKYFIGRSGFLYTSIEPSLKHYGIRSVTITKDSIKANLALRRGDWVIAAMGRSRWAKRGHYILAYGLTERNTVLVSDPASNSDFRQKDGPWSEMSKAALQFWIINNVASYMGDTKGVSANSSAAQPGTQTYANLDTSSADYLNGMSYGTPVSVDYTKLGTYLVELDRNSDNLDWKDLKSTMIIGALIEAGYMYTKQGKEVDTFRNPKAYDQCIAAINASKPFGYYMPARAKNARQVDAEMYQLSFLVRKYPPQLGVWLVLELTGTKAQNDKLIQLYETELIRLGLKDKLGIKCDRSYISKFSWEKIQNNWALWVDDPVSDSGVLDQLLTPEFFDIDGKG